MSLEDSSTQTGRCACAFRAGRKIFRPAENAPPAAPSYGQRPRRGGDAVEWSRGAQTAACSAVEARLELFQLLLELLRQSVTERGEVLGDEGQLLLPGVLVDL